MDQYQLVSRWIQGNIPGKLLPWQIDLDTTNICNQACYYCNTEQFRNELPVYQSVEQYSKLIDRLHTWRQYDPNVIGTLSNVIFSGGGEPTLLPGYEDLLEDVIDKGYVAAMNTNGTKLHKVLTIDTAKLKRMAYVGLDIDSGNPDTYELIRKSKMSDSPFDRVKETAKELGSKGVPLDIKALLMPENTSQLEINGIFEYARDVKARSVHLRPMVLNGHSFVMNDKVATRIKTASEFYNIKADVSLGRYDVREYKRCHQMFLFPSFCADGNIYLCCEYKGREDTKLGSWIDDDFRDIWGSDKHKEIYNNFITSFCKPCRPNSTNNKIQYAMNDYSQVIKGFI
jgi:sulfatase maturation enzyme AslB (radical SAM superfamily)